MKEYIDSVDFIYLLFINNLSVILQIVLFASASLLGRNEIYKKRIMKKLLLLFLFFLSLLQFYYDPTFIDAEIPLSSVGGNMEFYNAINNKELKLPSNWFIDGILLILFLWGEFSSKSLKKNTIAPVLDDEM